MHFDKSNQDQQSLIALAILALCLVCVFSPTTQLPIVHAQVRPVHVSGQALPASLTAPATLEGYALATNSVNVDYVILANKDTSSHTVKIVDCTASTVFTLLNDYTIAASTVWAIPLGGSRFQGCFKWTSDSTLVMGTMVGSR